MHCATKSYIKQVLLWLLWTLVLFAALTWLPGLSSTPATNLPLLLDAVYHEQAGGWRLRGRYRLQVWLGRGLRLWWRAVWAARLAWLAVQGALTLAQVVDWLTRAQLRRYLGALPVLYALLERLHVREIINHHCPTRAQVDHGTVVLVLLLNRLTTPQPLYQVADWLARTVLVQTLGVPAAKFNDDRLVRTLEELQPHQAAIWLDVLKQARRHLDLELRVLFYDLTAFVLHGEYVDSELADFGFAHNTPLNKRKFKAGLTASADGRTPVWYHLWVGRTADQATVQQNLAHLRQVLDACGVDPAEVLLVGDRANLNEALAFAYRDAGLRYLAGLQVRTKAHQAVLAAPTAAQLRAQPLNEKRGQQGYWGYLCQVPFAHEGRHMMQRGLVVLSGPMRSALRKSRATQLRALQDELRAVQAKIGQPHYRSVASVQQRAATRCKNSPVGALLHTEAYLDDQGHVALRWEIDRAALADTMAQDGRYLLVTNDWTLSARDILDLYRQKDDVEKCFALAKGVLQVVPVRLHSDTRIEGMMLIHMLALLVYRVLEREARQHGLPWTTQRIIARLQSLDVIVTECWDGSCLYRLTALDTEQQMLMTVLAQVIADLLLPRGLPRPLTVGIAHPRAVDTQLPLSLPPPQPPEG